MEKVRIKIGIIGYLPFEFNRKKIKNWRSDVFEVTEVDEHDIYTSRADTFDWGYSDETLNNELPQRDKEDVFIGITYVPIENNYYARRLDNNRVIISFCGICQDLIDSNIPVENLVLRVIYASSLIFIAEKNIPSAKTRRHDFLHDDTRRCIYDMTGNDKRDVIYSLDRPQLCDACKTKLKAKKIPNNIVDKVNVELKRIKKNQFFRISQFVKRKPLLSILLTFITGVIISLIANFIYDYLRYASHTF
jgi:hypothetical protein